METSHNSSEAHLLIDGSTEEASTWAGAEIEETEEEEKAETPKRTAPSGKVYALLELKEAAVVYGARVSTGGGGADNHGIQAYQAYASLDGERFLLMGSASERGGLPDEPTVSRLMFQNPMKARYLRIEIQQGDWHGAYPALREIEAFTDQYRPAPLVLSQNPQGDVPDVGVSFIQIRRDNCGRSLERSPHMTQGFPYDRGGSEPETRYGWMPDEEIEGEAEENLRTFAYHYDSVQFHYDGLSADRLYTLYVSYLQNTGGGRRQNLIVDGYLLHGDEPVPSAAQPPRVFAIPPQAAADGELSVSVNRVAGPNAVVSDISLYESALGADDSEAEARRRVGKIVQTHAPLTHRRQAGGLEPAASAAGRRRRGTVCLGGMGRIGALYRADDAAGAASVGAGAAGRLRPVHRRASGRRGACAVAVALSEGGCSYTAAADRGVGRRAVCSARDARGGGDCCASDAGGRNGCAYGRRAVYAGDQAAEGGGRFRTGRRGSTAISG